MSTNDRAQLRQEWLEHHHLANATITALPGDASFRRYFRLYQEGKNFLLMDAPPALEDSHSYVAIGKDYYAHDIHTPKIFIEDLTQGFLLIEDLGDLLLNTALKNADPDTLYKNCYEILPRIQACQHIPHWSLPKFCEGILMTELKNFHEWCVAKFSGIDLNHKETQLFEHAFDFLQKNGEDQPQVGVHRDYHSRNLMVLPHQKIGVIDFQDAVIGPLTYDLVSLLRDCYVNWPLTQVQAWVKDYYEKFADQKTYSLEQFQRWFDLQGIQRHLKALFIFCRKYLRDGSTFYLGDIPRTLNYVREISKQYAELHAFHAFVETRLTKALLEKTQHIQA